MSRRHHHHMQPYDYDRFNDHSRDRERERVHQTRGIEYQDDSLSSINSDEDSYLHHQHQSKDKKPTFYNKNDNKSNKMDKTSNEMKVQTSSAPDATSQRLERLENMLTELIKRNNPPRMEAAVNSNVVEKSADRRGQFSFEPRSHTFTTSVWINKIQEVSIQNNWDEKTTIAYMESQMSGILKAWYNSLENFEYTWPEWKILITKVFPDNTDFITTLKRLVTRLKQADESMSTYYFSKMYLIEACKITGEDAVSCLIDGLNNQSIQEQAKSQNYLTPETLYSQFLTVLPEYTVDYSPETGSTTVDPILNTWYYEEPIETEEVEEQFDYGTTDQDYRNHELEQHSKSPPKRSAPVHSRLDKRFIKTNNFRHQNKIPMAAKVCSICGVRGHLARNCRSPKKILYTKLSNQKTSNCFFKVCTVNGHKLDSFVDTGCTTITIRESDVKDMNLEVDHVKNHIQTFGGHVVEIIGETQISLEMDSVGANVRAVVVPDHVQDVAVIVGQEFLTQKNVCVLLQNETLKIFEAQ